MQIFPSNWSSFSCVQGFLGSTLVIIVRGKCIMTFSSKNAFLGNVFQCHLLLLLSYCYGLNEELTQKVYFDNFIIHITQETLSRYTICVLSYVQFRVIFYPRLVFALLDLTRPSSILPFGIHKFGNSAHADGGPRSQVCTRQTLWSAPHRHEQSISSAPICRLTFKHLPMQNVGTLKHFLNLTPYPPNYVILRGVRGIPEFFFWLDSFYFCQLGPVQNFGTL